MEAQGLAEDGIREAAVAGDDEVRSPVEQFRIRSALIAGFMILLLSICNVLGENAATLMMSSLSEKSNTFAFYQAKTIRQTDIRLQMELLTVLLPVLPAAQQELATRLIEDPERGYRATVARYDDEPGDKDNPGDLMQGEGKKQLLFQGNYYKTLQDQAQRQDDNFDLATPSFEIGAILITLAIAMATRRLLPLCRKIVWGGVAFGFVGILLMLNGVFLFV